MFYAMTRLHFEKSSLDELLSRAEASRDQIEAINGLHFAELITTGQGEGMIIAAYESEPSFDSMGDVLADWDDLLTSTPHGHEGTVVLSIGDAPRS